MIAKNTSCRLLKTVPFRSDGMRWTHGKNQNKTCDSLSQIRTETDCVLRSITWQFIIVALQFGIIFPISLIPFLSQICIIYIPSFSMWQKIKNDCKMSVQKKETLKTFIVFLFWINPWFRVNYQIQPQGKRESLGSRRPMIT